MYRCRSSRYSLGSKQSGSTFRTTSHCFLIPSHWFLTGCTKKSYKSQYREQGAASKLPFDGFYVTLILHTQTDCEFHFTAAIKFLPQSSRDVTVLSKCGACSMVRRQRLRRGMGVVTSDRGRMPSVKLFIVDLDQRG